MYYAPIVPSGIQLSSCSLSLPSLKRSLEHSLIIPSFIVKSNTSLYHSHNKSITNLLYIIKYSYIILTLTQTFFHRTVVVNKLCQLTISTIFHQCHYSTITFACYTLTISTFPLSHFVSYVLYIHMIDHTTLGSCIVKIHEARYQFLDVNILT